jgi:hypothetical protein
MTRYIATEQEWDALPVGTIAKVGYIETDDDGHENDGGTMIVLRR